jgi:ankyrin repeat protein
VKPNVPITSHRSRIFVRDPAYFVDRAQGLLAVVADGLPNAIQQVRQWHPAYAGATDQEIRNTPLTVHDAQTVYARQHGFDTWDTFASYLQALPEHPENEPFLEIFESAHKNDWERVTAVLRAHPDVVRAYGTNGNTLLNLAASLLACPLKDDSGALQSDPNRLSAMRLLLSVGADADAANDRGWTPLHQAAYRNDPEMVELLLHAGASPHAVAHGDGGTPLAVALFWGHREAATVLADTEVVPDNLRIAAATGRLDLVQQCFSADGSLTDNAKANRGFYRPHSGFPHWKPSSDSQEILDEALVWAAKSDRTNVMPALLQHGAHVNGEPYRGTALIWAAANNRLSALQWLLDHGADINKRTTFGGLSHGNGVTAMHLAAQNNHVDAVKLLLQRGADPTITDAMYGGTPRDWAEHGGAKDAMAVLRQNV